MFFPCRATDVISVESLKDFLPWAKFLLGGKFMKSGPRHPVRSGGLGDPSPNPVRLASGPCSLGIGNVRSSLRVDSLREPEETAHISKGVHGSGIAKTILNGWEAGSAPVIAGRRR